MSVSKKEPNYSDRLASALEAGFQQVHLNSPFGMDLEATFVCLRCGCLVRLPELHRTTCGSEPGRAPNPGGTD